MHKPSPIRVALPWLLLTVLGLPWLRATLPAPPVAQARPVAQATPPADTPTPDTTATPTPTPTTPPPTTTPTADYHLLLPLVEQGRPLTRYEWVMVTSPTTNTLRAVDMVSSNDGWAVGDKGTISHWDGQAWTTVPSPTTQKLNAVSMVSSSDGWAVGNGGIILHWNGQSWLSVPSPTDNELTVDLTALSILSAHDIWVAGSEQHLKGCNGRGSCECINLSRFFHWDGQQWLMMEGPDTRNYECGLGYTPRPAIRSLVMLSSTEGWAAGHAGLVHWDGHNWTTAAAMPPTPGWWIPVGLAMVSPTEGWAVGIIDYGAVSSTDSGPVDTEGIMLHYSNGAWRQVSSPTGASLTAVAFLPATNGWAVGFGTLIHWDGQAWRGAASSTGNILWSVAVLSTTEGWAVGEGGIILHYALQPVPWP